MDGEWPELFELLQQVSDLGLRFLIGDVLDIVKVLLSIAATVWFGRRYVKRHIRTLLEKQVQEIASEERLDRGSVKAVIQTAIDKARGLSPPEQEFDVKDTFETAARYCAQRQPEYGIELLVNRTLLAQAAAELSEERAHNARMEAATAQLQIGLIRRHQGDTVKALEAFKSMLALYPEDVDGLRFTGQELERQNRLSEAREYYERMEKLGVGGDDKLLIGEALRSLARVNDSFKDASTLLDQCLTLEKSIHHDVGIAHTWKTIGDLRCQPGHWKIAEEAYDNALKIFSAIEHQEAVDEVHEAMRNLQSARQAANQRMVEPTDV